uniref:Uncharacterized protein n=1 Tax=Mesocestoides corti TaxID=53468 RepID=A0A5K3F5A1_MESCO
MEGLLHAYFSSNFRLFVQDVSMHPVPLFPTNPDCPNALFILRPFNVIIYDLAYFVRAFHRHNRKLFIAPCGHALEQLTPGI